ncbi:MAG: PadR family transcriptional regulator [Acidobacteria bacterium]|nr:PadR family transcriptional regulator [Acidobacteriota bacterium]
MPAPKPDLLRGTLDLLVLEVLRAGPLHGYAIGQQIQRLSDDLLRVEQGSLYPALYRMHRRGWLRSRWGTASSGRRARIYSLTGVGKRRLASESAAWRDYAEGVQRVLEQLSEHGDS